MIPSFAGFYVIMVLCSVKLGIMGKELKKKRGGGAQFKMEEKICLIKHAIQLH
jgi:hypothetical protein